MLFTRAYRYKLVGESHDKGQSLFRAFVLSSLAIASAISGFFLGRASMTISSDTDTPRRKWHSNKKYGWSLISRS